MARRNVILFSAFGLGSYFAGTYVERHRSQTVAPKLPEVTRKPGLPIFGTVSAASPVVADSVTPASTRTAQIMKYGFPGMANIRSFDDYVLSYDQRNRVANWVFEHLTRDSVRHNDAVDRSKCEFAPDPSLHPFFRAENRDYKSSGFDRGHLAAAGNHKAQQQHCAQTFYLSNMAPQVGTGFNRDSWNRLERYVRKLTAVYPNVYCCTGPLYLPKRDPDGKTYVRYQVIGKNNVAVPTHFYKVVVGETKDGRLEMEAYVMPNAVIANDTPLTTFQVPPESIERAAGLLFFDRIARNQIAKINGKKV